MRRWLRLVLQLFTTVVAVYWAVAINLLIADKVDWQLVVLNALAWSVLVIETVRASIYELARFVGVSLDD